MKTWGIALVTLTMLACTSSESPASTDTQPASCELSQRSGTYMFHYSESSGDCGSIADGLVIIDDATAIGDGCTLLRDDRVSEGGCRLDRSIECKLTVNDPTAWGGKSGATIKTTGFTRQKTEDGSKLEGTASVSMSSDSASCSSTYTITATRQ